MKMQVFQNGDSNARRPGTFNADVKTPLFGEISIEGLELSQDGAEGITVEPVKSSLDANSADGTLLLIAFQFKGDVDPAALKQYVSDRDPALAKHGGEVLLSAVTSRDDSWSFDGMEIIKFPSIETIQSLMGDPDYQGRTKESGSAFGGAFAVAPLQVIQ